MTGAENGTAFPPVDRTLTLVVLTMRLLELFWMMTLTIDALNQATRPGEADRP